MLLYKALGLLLTYPTSDYQLAGAELRRVFADSPLSAAAQLGLDALLREIESGDLLDLQERYVNLFDRTQALSLHMFEHVHGSSRDRGQAMVDLQTMYSQHGLAPTTAELPDYLPMLCEFLSLLPAQGAKLMLGDLAVVLGLLRLRLLERQSLYASVFTALLELAPTEPDEQELREVVRDEVVDLPTFEQLDQQWQETEVTFGAGDARGNCDSGGSGDDLVQLRRGRA